MGEKQRLLEIKVTANNEDTDVEGREDEEHIPVRTLKHKKGVVSETKTAFK